MGNYSGGRASFGAALGQGLAGAVTGFIGAKQGAEEHRMKRERALAEMAHLDLQTEGLKQTQADHALGTAEKDMQTSLLGGDYTGAAGMQGLVNQRRQAAGLTPKPVAVGGLRQYAAPDPEAIGPFDATRGAPQPTVIKKEAVWDGPDTVKRLSGLAALTPDIKALNPGEGLYNLRAAGGPQFMGSIPDPKGDADRAQKAQQQASHIQLELHKIAEEARRQGVQLSQQAMLAEAERRTKVWMHDDTQFQENQRFNAGQAGQNFRQGQALAGQTPPHISGTYNGVPTLLRPDGAGKLAPYTGPDGSPIGAVAPGKANPLDVFTGKGATGATGGGAEPAGARGGAADAYSNLIRSGVSQDKMTEIARRHGVPLAALLAVAEMESGGNHYSGKGVTRNASSGALGAMQIMPGSAYNQPTRFGYTDQQLQDPVNNFDAAAQHLAGTLKRGGSIEQALREYMGTSGRDANGHSGNSYAASVAPRMGYYSRYDASGAAPAPATPGNIPSNGASAGAKSVLQRHLAPAGATPQATSRPLAAKPKPAPAASAPGPVAGPAAGFGEREIQAIVNNRLDQLKPKPPAGRPPNDPAWKAYGYAIADFNKRLPAIKDRLREAALQEIAGYERAR